MTTTDIICTRCGTKPRLKSLDKNSGTGVGCDCEGAKYHMDSVPFELTVRDLPTPWEIDKGVKNGSGDDETFLQIEGHTAVKGPAAFVDRDSE